MATVNPQGDVIFKARVEVGHEEYKGALTLGAMAMAEQICFEKAAFLTPEGLPKKVGFWEIVGTLDDIATCSHVALIAVVTAMIQGAGDDDITFEKACRIKFEFTDAIGAIIDAVKAIQSNTNKKKPVVTTKE